MRAIFHGIAPFHLELHCESPEEAAVLVTTIKQCRVMWEKFPIFERETHRSVLDTLVLARNNPGVEQSSTVLNKPSP